MKSDTLIVKRFQELETEAEEVAGTRRRGDYGDGIDAKSFNRGATSCLNLLSRVFGVDSDHYVNFRRLYDEHKGWANSPRRPAPRR